MNNKPKITFKKIENNYVSNEKLSSFNKHVMKEFEKHIAREKRIKEILEINNEQ